MLEQRSAYAKINLSLAITNKQPNGYHTIETIFAPINWFDTLTFSESKELSMSCSHPVLPLDQSNLCLKAALLLQERFHISAGVHIHLEKQIPFGAGLGGGSSNAACVLNFLNSYWNINLPLQPLAQLALQLGADVPYFVQMEALAFATGVGEQLTDLNQRFPFWIVTAFPNKPIATSWAYQQLNYQFPKSAPNVRQTLNNLINYGDSKYLKLFQNDFETVILPLVSEVRMLKQTFNNHGAIHSLMSGSGSAVFGIFDSQALAEASFESLSSDFPSSLTPPNFAMTNTVFVSS